MRDDAAKSRLGKGWLVLVATIVIAVLLPAVSNAEDTLRLNGTGQQAARPVPSMQMEMLIDPTRGLGLDEVLALGGDAAFEPVRGTSVNPGFTLDAIWLRMRIIGDADRQVLLSLTPNFVDLIDIYVARERPSLQARDFAYLATGDHRPLPTDAVSGLDNVVPLDLRHGETTLVYIRAASVNSALTVSASLYSPVHQTFRTTVAGLAFGVWFGGMAVLLVIQLVFFHFDRKPYYLLLAFATLVATLVYTGTLGLSRVFLFPGGGAGNDVFTASMTWLGLSASTLAASSILDLPRHAPWLNRLFLAIAGIGMIGVVCAAAGWNIAFSPLGNVTSVTAATVGAFQGLRTANLEGAGTRLRAAAYTILWLGVLATFAQRTGAIDLPNWVAHTYALSCLVQTILLTGALGVRLRAAEALNRKMQAEATVAAQRAERDANLLVEEKTRELTIAKQTAEDALRAELDLQQQQVRFMEVISHQYRTPLAAIRTHVDNIGFSLPESDDANRGRLARVRLGIARLVEVLEVNLTRSRLQGSTFQPNLVSTSVDGIVLAAVARARDLLHGNIQVELDASVPETRIMADADMLVIAIINLLENAVKYSANGSAEPVILSCIAQDGSAIISVADKGIGIPDDELPTILRHSIRGSNAGSVPGTGMGLSLTSRIISAHRGFLAISSAIGEGTNARITLPLRLDLPGTPPL